MRMSGAEAIIQVLIHEGVEVMFGYPGGAILPTYDAIHTTASSIKHVLVRHEQGAVLAAEGYAKVSGKVGVCLATSGPGATNLVTGIADAMLDSVPLVCITGQVSSALIGSDAFQEADIVGITIPITKWTYQITNAEDVPLILSKAFYYAKNGRPGPILIDITKDAQVGMLDFNYVPYKPKKDKMPKLSLNKIEQIAEIINLAKKPYILAGNGITIAQAEEELLAFAEKSGIPVACTLHGLSAFPTDNHLYAGLLGMHGNYAPNLITNQADVIIAIGMRFDDRVTGNLERYAKQAQIIHIDIDQAELNKNVKTIVSIVADAKDALTELIKYIKPNMHKEWVNYFEEFHKQEFDHVIKDQIKLEPGKPMRMAQVINMVSEKTDGQAIIVSDVGQNQMIAARYYKFKQCRSHITSGGLGTMGFALPAAIGAKFANAKREVISVMGDGGIQMNIQELAVITQEKLAVKILLLNNNHLGMVRQWQEMFYQENYSFSKLWNPDFIKIAEGYGIKGRKVSHISDLESGVKELIESKESFILEVIVENQEKVFPMMPAGSAVDQIRLS